MKLKRINPLATILSGMLMLATLSCRNGVDCCTIIDVDVRIHYQTQLGADLINSHQDFDESNIKIHYKNGDKYEYVFHGNLDYPNMHHVRTDPSGKLVLTVFPSNYYDGDESTTLIELNDQVIDTLVCEFELDSNREICKRAWLNGVEMENRYIEVKK